MKLSLIIDTFKFLTISEETNDKEETILTTQKSEPQPNENNIRNHKDTFIATLSKFEENSLKARVIPVCGLSLKSRIL